MRRLTTSTPSSGPVPSGFTLAETVVALVLVGVVLGAVIRALDRQARFHAGIVQLLRARQQLSASHDVLGAELRSLASPADVEQITDTSLVYRTSVGGGVVCRITGADLDLVPERLASGALLAQMRTPPQPGDTIWLADEGAGSGAADDRWHPAVLGAAARLRDGCLGTPLLDSVADRGLAGWRLSLAGGFPLPNGVTPGATARITRRARFALYPSSAGDWNLGWSDWSAALGRWNVIQPVSGPFTPFNRTAPQRSGVAFAASDSSGSTYLLPAPSPALGGISVTTRSQTDRVVRADGMRRGRLVDSVRSLITPRNRP